MPEPMTTSIFLSGSVDGFLPAGVRRFRDNGKRVRGDGANCSVEITMLHERRNSDQIGLALRHIQYPSFNKPSEHNVDLSTLQEVFRQKSEAEKHFGPEAYDRIWALTPRGELINLVKFLDGWWVQLKLDDLPRGGTLLMNSYRLKRFIQGV